MYEQPIAIRRGDRFRGYDEGFYAGDHRRQYSDTETLS